ncbi:MAG: helix-turn-helix transcriptional regulator [Terriglobia bacterium]|jgi:molybdopterin-binding protein
MELLHVPEAARELGVSYPTLKQWIYKRKIRTVTTPGGHHRVPRSEVDRLLFQRGERGQGGKATSAAQAAPAAPISGMGAGLEHVISGRNQLVGRIVKLQTVGLLTKVVLDVGGQSITSIITSDASRDLDLKVGETAAALIKATEVMIIRPLQRRP